MRKQFKILQAVSFTDRRIRFVSAALFVVLMLSFIFLNTGLYSDTYVSDCIGTRLERNGNINGTPLVQRFVPGKSHVSYIQIHLTDCSGDRGQIVFTVEDRSGAELYSEEVEIASIRGDDAYLKFDVDLHLKPGGTYYFKVMAKDADMWHIPKVWLSNNVKDEIRDVVYSGQPADRRLQTNTEIGYVQFHTGAYTLSIACILISGWTILLRLKLDEDTRRRICGIIMGVMPLVMFIVAECLNDSSVFRKTPIVWIVNYILYAAIYWIFFAITNHLRFTVLFSNILIFIIAIINYYKIEFRGEPFSFSDIVSFKTAMNVASEYTIGLRYMIVTTGCVFILITAVVSRFRYSMKKIRFRVIAGVLSLSVLGLLVAALFNADRYSASKNSLMQKLGIVNNVWNQPKNYTDNGLLVAITMNAKYLTVDPPSVYSLENMEDVTADIHDNYGAVMISGDLLDESARKAPVPEAGKLPNVIVIMDESYSDFSQFGDIEFTEEYAPFISSLADDPNAIKGELHVSTFGGGTANSEFEFLTGNTMIGMPQGSIPYQQYIDHETGSLARTLDNIGYKSIAVHPYLGSGWNRPAVYEYMGFDEFHDIEDFQDAEYIRSYISDMCSFKKVTELYEQNKKEDPDRPLFIFNVTMQNHGGYTKTYENFEPDVFYAAEPGRYTEAEQYFSVAHNTDAAVEYLVDYFSKCGEPTIICFFGDHLPSFKDGFYENILGVKSTSDLGPAEMEKMYTTDFFIWANYPIEKGEAEHVSLNYLSTLLMQTAGIPLTEYQLFLTVMYRLYPSITTIGICDFDGSYLGGSEILKELDIWNYYAVLEYNNVFEKEDRLSAFFDYPMSMAEDIDPDAASAGEEAGAEESPDETEG
ncbi:MAG: LTA synthase family protein [Clostridiales bacterium]|nr:LTA synthase family protein [Clostridiales bacterium]